MSKNSVITAIARTPIGSFQGVLSTVPTVRLGAAVIKSTVERSGLKSDQVDEVIMGEMCCLPERDRHRHVRQLFMPVSPIRLNV